VDHAWEAVKKRAAQLPASSRPEASLLLSLGNDLAELTSAWDLSHPKCKGNLEMSAGHFEQISDCWSSEQRPATYYRTTAARARKLQSDATTPRVKQYLDTMIAHCERLAGKVEPKHLHHVFYWTPWRRPLKESLTDDYDPSISP
jgi:hypothetical protein